MINVLDHGFVDLRDHMGDDLSICRAARVSYSSENCVQERTEGENRKLIRYMMCHKHTSPFEQVVFTFHVKAPIFVFRQWHRHRTWSFNEISGRYSELKGEFYVPTKDRLGIQSQENKQGTGEQLEKDRAEQILHSINNGQEIAKDYYNFFLHHPNEKYNLSRELARINLPLATYSEMYATVDLHNLFHFLKLRMDEHAQWEIQEYAKAIYELIKPIVPVACEAFSDYVLNAVTFSAQEMNALLSLLRQDFYPDNMETYTSNKECMCYLSKRELVDFKKKLGL